MIHRRTLPKEPLKDAILEVCAFYAGPARRCARREGTATAP